MPERLNTLKYKALPSVLSTDPISSFPGLFLYISIFTRLRPSIRNYSKLSSANETVNIENTGRNSCCCKRRGKILRNLKKLSKNRQKSRKLLYNPEKSSRSFKIFLKKSRKIRKNRQKSRKFVIIRKLSSANEIVNIENTGRNSCCCKRRGRS